VPLAKEGGLYLAVQGRGPQVPSYATATVDGAGLST